MSKPHQVTAQEVENFIVETWINVASATCADKRKRKRLYLAAGERRFQVRWRRPGRKEPAWKIVIDTVDLQEAVKAYNTEEFNSDH